MKTKMQDSQQLLKGIREVIKKGKKQVNMEGFMELPFEMICITGDDGYFKQVSSSFEKTLGYSKEELLSKPIKEFVLEDDQQQAAEVFDRLKINNYNPHYQNCFRCKDGTIKWLSWRSALISGENLIYNIGRDITKEKLAEIKLRQYTEKLEMYYDESHQSFRYAATLQKAILPDPDTLSKIFPESFIYHQPKQIVSGDFFWFEQRNNKAYFAVADCTGHGIPGAILSVMGINILHGAFLNKPTVTPSGLLDTLDKTINTMLTRKSGEKEMNDGMDIAICSLDKKSRILDFSGANRVLYLIRDGELHEYKSDKYSIGNGESDKIFSSQKIKTEKGDMIYIFSDGFADQFGGEAGKKFTYKRFRDLLFSIQLLESHQQKKFLADTLHHWKKNLEQTDDILVMGIKIE